MQLGEVLSKAQICSLKSNSKPETAEDLISGICFKYGTSLDSQARQRIESIKRTNENTFVYISAENGVQFAVMPQRSVNFAKSVGFHLKRGGVVWMHDNAFSEVTWDNWKRVYAKLCPRVATFRDDCEPMPTKAQIAELEEAQRLERLFNAARSVNLYKKMGKRGFNPNFDELKRRQQLEEWDKQFKVTVTKAQQIMSIV